MDKKLMHFFISNYVAGIEADIETKGIGKEWGKFLSLYILIDKDKTIHRMNFEKFTGDKELKPEERDSLLSFMGISLAKELAGDNEVKKPLLNLIGKVDIAKQTITVQFKYTDKSTIFTNL